MEDDGDPNDRELWLSLDTEDPFASDAPSNDTEELKTFSEAAKADKPCKPVMPRKEGAMAEISKQAIAQQSENSESTHSSIVFQNKSKPKKKRRSPRFVTRVADDNEEHKARSNSGIEDNDNDH